MSKSIYEEVLLKLKEIAENLTRKQWLELTRRKVLPNHRYE